MNIINEWQPTIERAKKQQALRFEQKGLLNGLSSGLLFGLNSALLALAIALFAFSGEVNMFAIPLIFAGFNDFFAALWLIGYNIVQGRGKEILRSFRLFPGKMTCLAALMGGPVAQGAYLLGIAFAGPTYAVPISALCPVVGALLSAVFLKEKIVQRVWAGMGICLVGAIVISYMPPEGQVENFYLGLLCAAIAAVGWGLEGVLSAFGGSILDPKVTITIRDITSGIAFFIVVMPIVRGFGVFQAIWQTPVVLAVLAVAALVAAISFLQWYNANSMCGVAKGMALNSTYVMWGIVFSAAITRDVSAITGTVVLGALLITFGAILVSVNPLTFFAKEETEAVAPVGSALPFRFRVLKELEEQTLNVEELMTCLHREYGAEKQFSKEACLDHLLSLKENGLLHEEKAVLTDTQQLLVSYQINDMGKQMLEKYLPKDYGK